MLETLLNYFDLNDDYKKMVLDLRLKKKICVFNMSQTERILSALSVTGKVLYLASDYVQAKKIYEQASMIVGNGCFLFPRVSDNLLFSINQSEMESYEKIKILYNLVSNKAKFVVLPIETLSEKFPNKQRFCENILTIKTNKNYEIKQIKKNLVEMGYRSVDLVDGVGQFSVRGDIVDIFPINSEYPYRLEFFDTLVESIKLFEVETQKSKEVQKELIICPNESFFLEEQEINSIFRKLDSLKTGKFSSIDDKENFVSMVEDLKLEIENKQYYKHFDFLTPLIKNLSSIFDYITDDFVVCIDESKRVYDEQSNWYTSLTDRQKDLIGSGNILPFNTGNRFFDRSEVLNQLNKFPILAHQKITSANRFFEPTAVYNFKSVPLKRYTNNFEDFEQDLVSWVMDGYKVIICAGNKKEADKLQSKLQKVDLDFEIEYNGGFKLKNSHIIPYELENGFCLIQQKIVVVGSLDIMPRKQVENKQNFSQNKMFGVPKVGDFVVHQVHGVGVCVGVTQLTGLYGTKDFVVVRYRNDDTLYVPIDQMNLLTRYSGAGEPKKLSKIGGQEFSNVKQSVKSELKEMAINLLSLYAEREKQKGYKYLKDEELQKEFENSFPYIETEDQLSAIMDVKKDMEQGKVMDRLICGDVGFGKTEVALRAAFKAIVNGKQVALVAPTTILVRQHFVTAKARMERFGVRVEVLDRFKSTKEQQSILQKLKEHKIDLICGTHRIFSKDVSFEDLGLLILDEEQKFGVEHKETLKQNYPNIDVLTLSATPIPRTLHMALNGIRDVSIIQTPPMRRLPIETYIMEQSDDIIKDVVNRELRRNGQTFILFNRVETIYAFSEHVRKLVPNARIVVGHGQLSKNELENVIYKFYNHEADVLICTTIIENGIDLPNANSLIVCDSDKLGLSQLYQIRGRVGRGNKQSFAYFTYMPNKILTESGYSRLDALSDFTELGSGFKIAMRDLEIRGSGNIFGAKQHGHIEKVGYDLYCKLLNRAISEIRGEIIPLETECQMKVDINAFIPEQYIQDSETRMSVYKSIAEISSKYQLSQFVANLEDAYGKIPQELLNLLTISLVKNLAQAFSIEEVQVYKDGTKLIFSDKGEGFKSEKIVEKLNKFLGQVVLNVGDRATISVIKPLKNSLDKLNFIIEFLT